jgi:hypothetical protein
MLSDFNLSRMSKRVVARNGGRRKRKEKEVDKASKAGG